MQALLRTCSSGVKVNATGTRINLYGSASVTHRQADSGAMRIATGIRAPP
ncbi:hypothetical protein [Rhodanobacter lindaniclasticus]